MARAVGPHGDAYVVRAGIVVEAAETVWERLRGGFEGKVGSMAPSAHSVQKPSRVKPVMAIPFVEHVTSLSPYTFVLSVEPKTPARANCSIERERREVFFPNSSEAAFFPKITMEESDRKEVTEQRLEQPLPKPRTDHSTQTRSLRSRSRIDWAVEAARRVRGELVVAGLQVDGLRGGAGAPTDAGGERPTC